MSDELREMLDEPGAMNSQAVKDLLDKIMERMAKEGFINPQQPPQVTPPPQTSARGQLGQPHERQPEQEDRGARPPIDRCRGHTAVPVRFTPTPAFCQHDDVTHESPALPFITSCPFASLKRIPCVKLADIR